MDNTGRYIQDPIKKGADGPPSRTAFLSTPALVDDNETAPPPKHGVQTAKMKRKATKSAAGLFECNWPGCNKSPRVFGSKGEWKYVVIKP